MFNRLMANSFRVAMFTLMMIFTAGTALGAMTMPGGDTFLNGEFEEIGYGGTGLGYVTPYLYVGDLATTDKPKTTAGMTNLAYDYKFSGLGTSLMTLTYYITNEDTSSFDDLRFMVEVQPDGSESWIDTANVAWGPQAGGDPDHFEVDNYDLTDLKASIVADNGLDDTNASGGAMCDVDFALQWNLASIEPGQIWMINIGLADDGTALSSRYLQAISVDTPDTELTFSGNAAVVPLPSALILMMSALPVLGLVRRRLATVSRSLDAA